MIAHEKIPQGKGWPFTDFRYASRKSFSYFTFCQATVFAFEIPCAFWSFLVSR